MAGGEAGPDTSTQISVMSTLRDRGAIELIVVRESASERECVG